MNLEPIEPETLKQLPRPLFLSPVHAGFPSPADDYVEKKLDLNEHLIQNEAATFFLRVSGDSMKDACIENGDLLIVDCSLKPGHRNIIIASLNGELALKRILKKEKKIFLAAENESYAPIEITEEYEFSVWGVVTYVVRTAR